MTLLPVADVSSRANHTDSWRILKPEINYGSCIRCMICWKFCPDNAINVIPGKSVGAPNVRVAKLEAPEIDMDYCKGCGICANECPEQCIDMSMETRREI